MNVIIVRILVVLTFFSVGLACADELSADSASTMTCGTNFVSVGDPEDAVLSACGEPSFRDGNRWTYNNQGSFVSELNMAGGRILSISTRASE